MQVKSFQIVESSDFNVIFETPENYVMDFTLNFHVNFVLVARVVLLKNLHVWCFQQCCIIGCMGPF